MPKFYCEYCGIYLTHSSPSGRGQHAKGRKHINNRIEYYKQVIDDITKENQDKLKSMQGTNSTTPQNPPQMYPGSFQSMQQLPMLQQLQQLKAGGISQLQINNTQQGGAGAAPPGQQPPLPMLQPPFINMPNGGIGMPPPPLRPGQQQPLGPPPMGMLPQNNMMPPPMLGGMKPMQGMPPMGPPGQFMPPPGSSMMGLPPNMPPPMGFQPPPHHLVGNSFNQQGMDANKGGEYQNEDKRNQMNN